MGQEQKQAPSPPPSQPPIASAAEAAATQSDSHPPPSPPPFDPSRMIGIIKRKALIKKLAAVYHAECLAYCQELLELQKNWEEPFVDLKTPDDSRKEPMRPPKRLKKTR
ncbi:uncharacterized protein LOC105634017 [Jatropha curcas]|uniref:uncharacterized protein LOC105634017 n=1 Tax=Jatropha curcas TaxID=180498 RepID=UPI0005FBFA31|nr:uncharacterized protein LOC105634017 [Jatropha curcas]XP_012072148.1 uncharacterized protein LOC105634017 [Jatropha curcas]